jgi:hypothetical protein
MSLPSDFFTLESMLTLTGASSATYLIANGCQNALNFNPKWFALAVAQALSWYGTYSTTFQVDHLFSDYFVALVNGFLIYATAVGANVMTGTPRGQRSQMGSGTSADSLTRRSFFQAWF